MFFQQFQAQDPFKQSFTPVEFFFCFANQKSRYMGVVLTFIERNNRPNVCCFSKSSAICWVLSVLFSKEKAVSQHFNVNSNPGWFNLNFFVGVKNYSKDCKKTLPSIQNDASKKRSYKKGLYT